MLKEGFKFYYKVIKLKEILRQGYIKWGVKGDRIESVAEHVFGSMILAVSLYSQLKLSLDLNKVLEMITYHELEEIEIGDLTVFDDKSSQKNRKIIEKIVGDLNERKRIVALIDEFNMQESKEAKFARAVDKLECALQMKKYQDLGLVTIENVTPQMLENKRLKEYIDSGKYDLADIFFLWDLSSYEEYGITEELWFKELKKLKID